MYWRAGSRRKCSTATSDPGSRVGSVRALACEDGDGRPEQDGDVQPDRPVLDVVEVEPDQVVECQVGSAGDLPQARHAGEHVVAAAVPFLEPLVVAYRERPGA